MPHARQCRILLRRTRHHGKQHHRKKEYGGEFLHERCGAFGELCMVLIISVYKSAETISNIFEIISNIVKPQILIILTRIGIVVADAQIHSRKGRVTNAFCARR